jgi:hypothetical protein
MKLKVSAQLFRKVLENHPDKVKAGKAIQAIDIRSGDTLELDRKDIEEWFL